MKHVELKWDKDLDTSYFVREAFNSLRANILFSGKDVKTIVITSCYAHEGKSSVSFDLCRNLAESGKKVLLVDADLRKSVLITRYTKEKNVCGLSQILSGQVESSEAIYRTQVEGFDVVFAGPYPPNPTELVGSPAFKEFLDEERERYDYIIVDAPPLGLVIDAAVISGVCDGAVLVINIGHVKYRVAQGVKTQIEKAGCKVLGVVLNQVDRKRSLKSDQSYYSAYISGSYGAYADGGRMKRMQDPSIAPTAAKQHSAVARTQPVQRTDATQVRGTTSTVRPSGVSRTQQTRIPPQTRQGTTGTTPVRKQPDDEN